MVDFIKGEQVYLLAVTDKPPFQGIIMEGAYVCQAVDGLKVELKSGRIVTCGLEDIYKHKTVLDPVE